MVEIKTKDIARFLAKPSPAARLIVLAGRDRGRVKEASTALTKQWLGPNGDPLNCTSFQATEWKPAPQLVLEAALSPSLLGGQRVIRLIDGDKAMAPTMEDWLNRAGQVPDALVIVEAGDIPKTDALRKLATKNDAAALVFFYADEARDVAGLIKQIINDENGLRVEPDAMALLQQNLGADRAISRGELEKLAIYVGDDPHVTVDHVMAVVSDASGLEFEDLIHAVSGGDFKTLDYEFFRLIESGENPNTILTVVRSHFAKLNDLRFLMDGGLNFANASGQMRPPLFWKSKPKFQTAIDRWSSKKLDSARTRILDTFVDLRTTGRPEVETAQRGLFALAALARAQ